MLKVLFLASMLNFGVACSSIQPQKFEANIPKEPVAEKSVEGPPIKDATIIILQPDGSILLKGEKIGTIDETEKLEKGLAKIFDAKKKSNDKDATTVFVRAEKTIKYGEVDKLVEKLKKIGAAPIGLQIEGMEE